MSYSFTVQAPTKDEAKVAVAAKFDEVVASQPIHAEDRVAVIANASAVIDLLVDDPDKNITVSVSGYLGWVLNADGRNSLSSASVSASALLVKPD